MENGKQNNYITNTYKIKQETRVYQLNAGDILYCNQETINKLIGYECKLKWNDEVYIKENKMILPVLISGYNNFTNSNSAKAKVVEVHKTKKYPNKKWWQFWLKQEEYIDGYNLMIL